MIKTAFAAVAAASALAAPAAFAGPYVNVEANSGWTGSNYTGTTTDAHVGYEGTLGESSSWYVQGGAKASSLLTVVKLILFLLVRQVSVLLLLMLSVYMAKSPSLVLATLLLTVVMVLRQESSIPSDLHSSVNVI